MFRSIRWPSPALIIACLALVVALSGTGYADVAVVSSKVKNGSLLAADFKAGQLGGRGYEIVRGRSEATNQNFNSVAITCPTGKRAIGGGGGTAGGIIPGDGPYIVVSQPFDAGGGWLVQTARKTQGDSALLGYAICAEVP